MAFGPRFSRISQQQCLESVHQQICNGQEESANQNQKMNQNQSQRSLIDVTPPNTLTLCLSWVGCARCPVAAQSANYHLQMLVSFGVLLLLILTKARNDQQQFNRPYGNDLSPNHPDYFSKVYLVYRQGVIFMLLMTEEKVNRTTLTTVYNVKEFHRFIHPNSNRFTFSYDDYNSSLVELTRFEEETGARHVFRPVMQYYQNVTKFHGILDFNTEKRFSKLFMIQRFMTDVNYFFDSEISNQSSYPDDHNGFTPNPLAWCEKTAENRYGWIIRAQSSSAEYKYGLFAESEHFYHVDALYNDQAYMLNDLEFYSEDPNGIRDAADGTIGEFPLRSILVIIRKGFICYYKVAEAGQKFKEILNLLEYTHSYFAAATAIRCRLHGGRGIIHKGSCWPRIRFGEMCMLCEMACAFVMHAAKGARSATSVRTTRKCSGSLGSTTKRSSTLLFNDASLEKEHVVEGRGRELRANFDCIPLNFGRKDRARKYGPPMIQLNINSTIISADYRPQIDVLYIYTEGRTYLLRGASTNLGELEETAADRIVSDVSKLYNTVDSSVR
ncbi:unnamed protein product [Toxocara canis]|uniref:CUB domain-containing protein n=1 Tax=Toxocara canis TaxID=6265 RepID=A0A183URB7_TOXCA|nr:unnamed protein product [Toxocara canis]